MQKEEESWEQKAGWKCAKWNLWSNVHFPLDLSSSRHNYHELGNAVFHLNYWSSGWRARRESSTVRERVRSFKLEKWCALTQSESSESEKSSSILIQLLWFSLWLMSAWLTTTTRCVWAHSLWEINKHDSTRNAFRLLFLCDDRRQSNWCFSMLDPTDIHFHLLNKTQLQTLSCAYSIDKKCFIILRQRSSSSRASRRHLRSWCKVYTRAEERERERWKTYARWENLLARGVFVYAPTTGFLLVIEMAIKCRVGRALGHYFPLNRIF